MMRKLLIALILLGIAKLSLADEIRPGYLEIKENTADVFSVLWKVPAKGEKKLGLNVRFPENCKNLKPPVTLLVEGAYLQYRSLACEQGLTERSISIDGLNSTSTDVLLRLSLIDGTSQTAQLTPTSDSYTVQATASSLQIAGTYTVLGIEHILLGIDHLLFVFALLLIVNSTRRLVITITAFTIAHSITLAAATLGYVHVPQQPVEAVIALSILFLAVEIVHGQQGRPGYAARWPWLVAFIFGLLHGFGFAGALAEVGLPEHAIPLALVLFNVGVELGQLIFVFGVILGTWLLHQLKQQRLINRAEVGVVYSIGGLSSFWLIERISLF